MSIFFANAAGEVVGRVLDTVSQGSALANPVVLIAPFASSNAVTVAYTLPNGINTQPFMLTPAPDLVQDLQDAEGRAISAWSGLIPDAVTEFAGRVTVQFFVYTAYSSANNTANTILATVSDFITVNKGVSAILPPTPSQTIYDQILANFAALGTEIDNLDAYVKGGLLPVVNNHTAQIAALDTRTETLETSLGTLTLTYATSTHILSLQMNGQPLGAPIDLPLESTVVGGRYDAATKDLILILQNGDEINIPLDDIIQGLVNESQIVQQIDSDTVGASNIPSTRAVSDFVQREVNNADEGLREEINSALNSLTFDGTDLEFSYGVESGGVVPRYLGSVEIPIDDIYHRLDSIVAWVLETVGTITTIEGAWAERVTASGANIVSDTLTKVLTITGDTYDNGNGGIANAYFDGIRSTNADGTEVSELTVPSPIELACCDTIDVASQTLERATAVATFPYAGSSIFYIWRGDSYAAGVFVLEAKTNSVKPSTDARNFPSFINNGYTKYTGSNPAANMGNKTYALQSNGFYIYIRNTDCTTVTEFRAYLQDLADAGTPLIIAYKGVNSTVTDVETGDSYKVWNGGTEESISGDTITTEQEYVEKAWA